MGYPLGKNSNLSTFWTSPFYSLEKRFFLLEYRKRHFPGLGKNVNFSTFWISCFYGLERRFFILDYQKKDFPGLSYLKKKLEKWPFLDENHRLTPFEKCQFFDFLKFLFLYSRKAFIRSRIFLKTFSYTVLPKNKGLKNGHFYTKKMG